MSCSLLLSPRLSPAALRGVSHEMTEGFRWPARAERALVVRPDGRIYGANFNFSEQWSAPLGALPTLGVRTQIEELPITAA